MKLKKEIRQPLVVFLKICFSAVFFGAMISCACWAGDYKIAIDIGHTRNHPGATSARGVPEYLFNKKIAALLYAHLRQDKNLRNSFIINETGDDLSLASRAAIASQGKADLLLSIHHDSVEPRDLSYWVYQGKILTYCDKFAGHSVYYSEKNGCSAASFLFAVVLGSEMLNAGFCPTLHHAEKFTGGDKELVDPVRGIYKYNNLIVLKSATMPAVLFECGIIKSRKGELTLDNASYQRRLALALYEGIKKYFRLMSR